MKQLKDYSESEQHALRNEVCSGANDNQIAYYLRVCEAKKIDPFSGLLYLQVRTNKGKEKAVVAATIDGSRLAAARSGEFAGSDEPEYDDENAQEPAWCRVTVYRMIDGEKCAFTAKIRMKEFKPAAPNDYMWRQKPYHMLGKTCEAQALRKGFPEYVSSAGEDEQDESIHVDEKPAAASPDQVATIVRWSKACTFFRDRFKFPEAELLEHIGRGSVHEIENSDFDLLDNLWKSLEATEKEAKEAAGKEPAGKEPAGKEPAGKEHKK